ncbi:hypothetical protein Q7P37_008436 [Cladosporium fusiforme]
MANTPNADLEKNCGLSITEPVEKPQHHHHQLHARERLRHFLHPNGTRIHVADSPVEAEHLRRRLPNTTSSDEPFTVCISGSPEHITAVQESQDHHEARRAELQHQHGEVWSQFANVTGELDALNRELGRVTDKGVSLEGHFGKFGYSAKIQSYDGDSSIRSGASSPREETPDEAPPLLLFKVPVVRQYFHKGILWRASTSEEVRSFELFVDLLYVGIIAINGDAAAENPTGYSLLKFIITFTLSWKIWNDMAIIIAWFETDDIFQRISILFLLACLFGYTTNIVEAFSTTYATLIGFYLAARLYMTTYLALVAWLVPMIRPVMIYYVVFAFINTGLWIGSIHGKHKAHTLNISGQPADLHPSPWEVSYPNQLALIFIALFSEIAGQTSYIVVLNLANRYLPFTRSWASQAMDFHPALNIEHRVERTNAFISLVFGYTVVAILYQSAMPGIDAIFGKAILALIQPFAYNWLYFELDGAFLSSHAIRRAKFSAMTWSVAHLPFIMSFVLGGGGMARLVLTTDTDNTHEEMLTETYRARSEHEVAQGIRWFYCVGFGLALLFMCVISLSHTHKDLVGMRLSKRWRLSLRAAVAIVMICLPLAGDHLNSLDLIGIMTALIVFTTTVEAWGVSKKGSGFIARQYKCGYVGSCGKKDLQAALGKNGEVDVDALGEKSRYKQSGVSNVPM